MTPGRRLGVLVRGCLWLLVLVVPGPVRADEESELVIPLAVPYGEEGAPLIPEPFWRGEVELGLLLASGNTERSTVQGRADVNQERALWRHNLLLEMRYTKDTGVATTERYRAATQVDYKFSEVHYAFVRGAWEDDRFSSYDFRTSGTVGYGRRLWQLREDYVDLTAGAGYRYTRLQEPDDTGRESEQSPILRLAARMQRQASVNVLLRQELTSEIGGRGEGAVSESISSLQSALLSTLAMKVSFRMRHDTSPPPEDKRTDTETTLTLLYGF